MSRTPVLDLLMGLLFATTLLTVGIAIGFWLGKRKVSRDASPTPNEQKLKAQTQQLAGYLTEARTDALTGLPNRRAFDQKMDECFRQWQQTKQVFSMALIDIDHFKNVNDTFGHPAGDAVLREIATRLNHLKNDSIIVARYGGEEFAVLFDGDEKHAATVLERLRIIVADTAFKADSLSIPITISCGVARINAEERIGKLVRRSDEALYSAKIGGRNSVYLHNGVVCESFEESLASHLPEREHANTQETPPTIDELEHRVLARLDRLVSQEANHTE
jgi:diguanylate cyclase (GGDEF)-like protein